jgi:CHRD domain-containing protein
MFRLKLLEASLVAAVVTFAASYGYASEFSARLSGFNELGSLPSATAFPTGAVLSDGTGTVSLQLNQKAGTIDYTLSYSKVGTTPPKTGTVSQAHIHFGKSRDSGGVLVFFCTNLTFSGTGPTPKDCPKNSGTVSGTWTKANVQAIAGQNVVAGDFDALVDALTSNTAYANVHTISGTTPDTAFPAGEIRGQIHSEDKQDQEHRED